MRILITGAGGLLGGRLCELLAKEHKVTGLVRSRPAPSGVTSVSADLADPDAARAAIANVKPNLVIHCAALADVEVCERDPDLAWRDNVHASRNLAAVSRDLGARFVFISTDLVFDGARSFTREDDATAPLMAYGRAKVAAERASFAEVAEAVVFRVALICGRGFGARRSASEGIAARLTRGESVRLYDDEWRTPIDPDSIGAALRALIARPEARGVFHIAGADRLSRYELGLRTAASLGLPAALIERASQADHKGAPRPADVSLDIARARETLGWTPRPLDEVLRTD